ncbi:MAG: hypothetical protein V1817_03890, partial [Candidatus Micrarchaeota archaeon]
MRKLLLSIEPVYGCRFPCPKCALGNVPKQIKYMKPSVLDQAFKQLKKEYALTGIAIQANFTMRGNPLGHEDLSGLVKIIKMHVPSAKVTVFWSLLDVPTQKDLINRTKGIDALVISWDTQHHRSVLDSLRAACTSKQLPGGKQAYQEMPKRLKWARNAQQKNNFRVELRIVGSGSEQKLMAKKAG